MAKILVVEDDVGLALTIGQWLEQEHHSVQTEGDGSLASDLIAASEFDLVILDLILPKVSGMELCKQIREKRSGARILMLTGRIDINDKEQGFAAGADDYLTKPFEMRELIARVRALLKRSL